MMNEIYDVRDHFQEPKTGTGEQFLITHNVKMNVSSSIMRRST